MLDFSAIKKHKEGTGEFYVATLELIELNGECFDRGVYGTYSKDEFLKLFNVITEVGDILEKADDKHVDNAYFNQRGHLCLIRTGGVNKIDIDSKTGAKSEHQREEDKD